MDSVVTFWEGFYMGSKSCVMLLFFILTLDEKFDCVKNSKLKNNFGKKWLKYYLLSSTKLLFYGSYSYFSYMNSSSHLTSTPVPHHTP